MKHCPMCKGEGKVKDDVEAAAVAEALRSAKAAALRSYLKHGLRLVGQALVLAVIPFAVTGALVGLAHLASWSINLPLQTRDGWSSDRMSPNGFLMGGAFVGVVGGLGLSFSTAFRFKWKK